MSVLSIKKAGAHIRQLGMRLRHDIRGVAAVELAMITPMLLLFMVGTLEVSRAINVDKRVNNVTSMTGDLISRESDMGANPTVTLDAIMNVVTHAMHPYDPATLKLSVIPVMADATDETKTFVYAAPYNYNGGVGGVPGEGTCYDFGASANIMTKGSSAIVVKAEYAYTPMLVGFFDGWSALGVNGDDISVDDGGRVFSDQSIHSPRSGCVDFAGNNCVVATPGGC